MPIAKALLATLVFASSGLSAMTAQTPSRDGAFAELRGALDRLAGAQEEFRELNRGFAVNTWQLAQLHQWEEQGGVTIAIIDANDSGWSGVAIHRALPALRCVVTVAVGAASRSEPSCSGEPDLLVLTDPNPTGFELQLRNGNRLSAQCPADIPSPAAGRVLLEFNLDKRGRPDLHRVRVAESTDIRLSYVALKMLSRCRFAPAVVDGEKVASRRVSPFNIVVTP